MRCRLAGIAFAALTPALLVSSCGGSSSTGASSAPQATTTTTVGAVQQNACPIDGCRVEITKVEKAGTELRITWTANYKPDFSKNHIHVFWNTYTANQVSNDAASRGVVQGEWVPTAAYPTYATSGAVSTARRRNSTKVCVTAGDRDHNVIDAKIVNCRDVANLL